MIYRTAGAITALEVKIMCDKNISLPWDIRKDSTFLGSENNVIAIQERVKQIKANAIYKYERRGCKSKLKLASINTSYNTATYVTRESQHSAPINP